MKEKEKRNGNIHIPSLKTSATETWDGRRRRIYTRSWINPRRLHGRFSKTDQKEMSWHRHHRCHLNGKYRTLQDRGPPNGPFKTESGVTSCHDAGTVLERALGSARLTGRAGNHFFCFADIIFHCLRNFVVVFFVFADYRAS